MADKIEHHGRQSRRIPDSAAAAQNRRSSAVAQQASSLLVAPVQEGHKREMSLRPAIFDRQARKLRRDRADPTVLHQLETLIAEALLERLDAVKRLFAGALVINTGTGLLADALIARGIATEETDFAPGLARRRSARCCDEDALVAKAQSVDLVMCPWGLDTVDDLPGALILARRALRPGGLFLGALAAAPTLPVLRKIILTADGDHVVARTHPLIDVRTAGDLLVRAGFALSVADLEKQTLAYPNFDRLIADLRAVGATNVAIDRLSLDRAWFDRARRAFAKLAGTDGRTVETVSLAMLTGWAPETS